MNHPQVRLKVWLHPLGKGSVWHLITAVVMAATTPPTFGASLTPLGDLPGGSVHSRAFGVSADGATVVGESVSANGLEAFRWQGGVMSGLGDLPGAGFNSSAQGVSADGSIVVGRGNSLNGSWEAFRWENGTMSSLGNLPNGVSGGGSIYSAAFGVSAAGGHVVGYGATANGAEAARWQDGVISGLGELPGGITSSAAVGVSADGAVVAGSSSSVNGLEAFRWENGVMIGLGDLPGGIFQSQGRSISADGGTVVGSGISASGTEAFRWQGGVMSGLGDLPGGSYESAASGVSQNGGTVVGIGTSTAGPEAFLWREEAGMKRLWDVLLEAGIDAALPANGSWNTLPWAFAITPDGRFVTGYGIRNGNTEAFLADLGVQAVPEPSTWAAGLALAALAAWQWRRARR